MESFFARNSQARWPKTGRLHVYATPPDERVAAVATAYQDLLAARAVPNLSRQPGEWPHLSVERLNCYLDEFTDTQLAALASALHTWIASVPAFTLQVGPALVSLHSITLDAVPDQPGRELRRMMRQAATDALGSDAVDPMTGHGRPHLTITYATGHVDIEPHLGALNHLRIGRATFPVSAAHLVAVHQHTDRGTCTRQRLQTFNLG